MTRTMAVSVHSPYRGDMTRARLAAADDAESVARLLHDFNTESDTETPGPTTLARRLRTLLAGTTTFAVLGGEGPDGVALVTLRTNVWFDGRVALLDELYVSPVRRGRGIGGEMIAVVVDECATRGVELLEVNVDEGDVDALRFYGRHDFELIQPETEERAFYLSRMLRPRSAGGR